MNARKFLLGCAGGFAAGYAAYRAAQSARSLQLIDTRPRDPERYGSIRRAFTLASIARSMAGSAAVAFGPVGLVVEKPLERLPVWLRPAAFAIVAGVLDAIADVPVDFYEDHVLERSYALSEQTHASWLSDAAKEYAIGTAVSALLAGLFAGALRRWPAAWPFIASAGIFPLLVLANIVVPIYIMPLFNRYTPIEGALEQRLRALAARYGAGNAEILRVDMSKQTKKANAFVTGIGGTHRIVVGDTLIEQFPIEEIEFVVAHELGHYLSKDSWRLIAAAQISATLVVFATFAALGKNVRESADRPVTLVRLQFAATLLAQLLRPAICGFARSREWAADRFALRTTDAPLTGASALRRLREQNLAEDQQPAWYEFLLSTHPSLKARISALETAAG
jgi:STE24 endopeptidase